MSHSHNKRKLPPKQCSSCKRLFDPLKIPTGWRYRPGPDYKYAERSKAKAFCVSCYPDFLKGAWTKLNRWS